MAWLELSLSPNAVVQASVNAHIPLFSFQEQFRSSKVIWQDFYSSAIRVKPQIVKYVLGYSTLVTTEDTVSYRCQVTFQPFKSFFLSSLPPHRQPENSSQGTP